MDSRAYFSVFSLRVSSWGGKKKSVINGCVTRYEIMRKYVILGIAGSQIPLLGRQCFFSFFFIPLDFNFDSFTGTLANFTNSL